MIAADTSALIAWLKGEPEHARVSALLTGALKSRRLALPSVVLTELFSAPGLPPEQAEMLRDLETLPLSDGYWERAGLLRAAVSRQGYKARRGDVLVAQACIDAGAALIASDRDFRHFIPHGLTLAA